jgi:hypothetical protein
VLARAGARAPQHYNKTPTPYFVNDQLVLVDPRTSQVVEIIDK